MLKSITASDTEGETMRKYIMIAIGGFLGAILRVLIKNIPTTALSDFPWLTLLINVTGSFLLAFIFTAAVRFKKFNPDIKHGITTGFFGAFTTFSTLCKETVYLMGGDQYSTAALYIILSVAFGFTAAYLGGVFVWKKSSYVENDITEKDTAV